MANLHNSAQEIWKPVPTLLYSYEASSLGRLCISGEKPEDYKMIITPKRTWKGYLTVSVLSHDLKRETFFLHRVIASAFIANPDNKPHINHKNGIKTDNRPENLEWVTPSENNLHSMYELGHVIKAVIAIGQGKKLYFASLAHAAVHFKTCRSNISKVCQGKRKQCKGFMFQYAKL